MICENNHTYQEMLEAERREHAKMRPYGVTSHIVEIQPKECPICGTAVGLEMSDFTLVKEDK